MELLIVAAILFLSSVVIFLFFKNQKLKNSLQDIISSKQSLSTKYGQMSEQFFPFLDQYPYDKNNFRFIGSPVDGIQFEKDKIIFVEFKTNTSSLSIKQRNIKDLIKTKKVKFKEFRID